MEVNQHTAHRSRRPEAGNLQHSAMTTPPSDNATADTGPAATNGGDSWPAWPRSAVRWLAVAVLIYLATVAGTAVVSYYDTRQTLLTALDQELLVGASTVQFILAADFHDRAQTPNSISPAEDRKNIRALSQMAAQGGFAFIYTAISQDGAVILTSSSATEAELDAGEDVRYFDRYDEAHLDVQAALAGQAPILTSYTDRWGRFRAAVLPMRSAGGRPYVAVAEYQIDDIAAQLKQELLQSTATALALLLASLPMFLLLLRRERRIARKLQQANRAIRDAQAKLVQSERLGAIGQLAAGVAHELNNPLMGVVNYTEYVAKELGEDHPQHQQLAKSKRAAEDCLQIVRDLLLFARGTQGPATASTPQRLADVLGTVLHLLDYRLRKHGVTVQQDIPDSLPKLQARGTELQQVLMNLLVNAIDATQESGEKRIRIEAEQRDATLIVRVRDTGEGIAPDKLAHIFEPFFTTKPIGSGTGLGLPVTLGIIQGVGGTVACESRLGDGTCFEIHWPISPG